MNKRTVSLSEDEYRSIVEAISNGFSYTDSEGKEHKFRRNRQLATICVVEATTGLRISDVLNLSLASIKKDGNRHCLDITEQKTGKHRNFTVPEELFKVLQDYAIDNGIKRTEPLFSIKERGVQKQLAIVAEYLGLEGISTHSFRKTFAHRVYEKSEYNAELVRQLLQHTSVVTTQRYLGIGTRQVEQALKDVATAFLCV